MHTQTGRQYDIDLTESTKKTKPVFYISMTIWVQYVNML